MEKLNIPPDLAQRLFGVESIDLSSIRSKIEEEIAKIGKDKGQEDLLKQLQGLLKKVDKMDADALKERMKRYTEFLKKGQTERVKIKLDELRELSKLEEDYQNNKIGAADYSLAKKGIQDEAEKKLARTEAIIYSMTPEERRNPKLMNPSRKNRIAKGAGVDIAEVNRLVKQFEQMKKMMKQMPGLMGGKRGKRGMFGKLLDICIF